MNTDTSTSGRPPPELHQFQANAIARLHDDAMWHKRQMLMAPTGAGKTIIGMDLIRRSILKGKRVIFVVDRRTLVKQTCSRAMDFGLDFGVMAGGHPRRPGAVLQIATAQTLAVRGFPNADLVVVDEAHTQYSSLIKALQGSRARVIGLSATPFSDGLGQQFSNLVVAATARELTDLGLLSPLQILTSQAQVDLAGIEKNSDGEWKAEEVGRRSIPIVGDVVKEWAALAVGRKTLAFASSVAHAQELAGQFTRAGHRAAVVSHKTEMKERDQLIEEFSTRGSTLRILVSVEALAKGFDVPDVSCIVDCRPFRKSLSSVIQMWGRGLRASPDTDKQDCLLLDFCGNVGRFLEDYEEVFNNGISSLDAGEHHDRKARAADPEKEERACPECGYKPFARHCLGCGHQIVIKAKVEYLEGDLIEVKRREFNPGFTALERLAQVSKAAKKMGKPDRAVYGIYKDLYGQPPPRACVRELAETIEVPEIVFNRIKYLDIRYHKSRHRKLAATASRRTAHAE